jgi:murein DD-endopeptidase MepM/ murein hydrolase activator NlpD
MGSTQPGRHRAAKHAAPKKSRVNTKKAGSVLGVSGLGLAALTSASSAPVVSAEVAPVVTDAPATPVTAAAKRHTITVVARKATLSRARAASRSEVRVSAKDAAATTQAATAGDPTAVLDTTPTLTSAQRFALRAVAPTTDQLDGLVAQTEAEQGAHAKQVLAFRQAKKDAVAAAALAERKRAIAAANSGSSDGSAVGTNGFSWTTSVVQLTAADQDILRATLPKRVAPVRGGYKLSGRFGERGWIWSLGWHTGIDFDVPTGSTVVAAADGVIVRSGWAGSYGYRIEIDHGNGFVTTYNHMSRIEKTSGAVSAGEEIGKSGSTGNVTGPHVHFEVLKGDAFVNPSQWLWGN